MTTTTTSYRKTKTGEWVVFGPSSLVHAGQVIVTKRDGTTKTETVDRVGRTFNADGIEARYGYIAERHAQHSHRIPRAERCIRCGGSGSVEQELGTCEACGADFDC